MVHIKNVLILINNPNYLKTCLLYWNYLQCIALRQLVKIQLQEDVARLIKMFIGWDRMICSGRAGKYIFLTRITQFDLPQEFTKLRHFKKSQQYCRSLVCNGYVIIGFNTLKTSKNALNIKMCSIAFTTCITSKSYSKEYLIFVICKNIEF